MSIPSFRYVRFRVFQALLWPFSRWARRRRMQAMLGLMRLHEGTSVLDLGGDPRTWEHEFLPPLRIKILNLPEMIQKTGDLQHNLEYIEGDGCDVKGLAANSMDLVFSNSVIEHVGGAERRAQFAREVRRIGRSYWVQTPSIWFPIEAHCGMPLWWCYPRRLRERILRRWREKLPAWTDMIEGTTVVKRAELRKLFPDAKIKVERVFGIPKSYIAFKPGPIQPV
jgi:hypothetical protein